MSRWNGMRIAVLGITVTLLPAVLHAQDRWQQGVEYRIEARLEGYRNSQPYRTP